MTRTGDDVAVDIDFREVESTSTLTRTPNFDFMIASEEIEERICNLCFRIDLDHVLMIPQMRMSLHGATRRDAQYF